MAHLTAPEEIEDFVLTWLSTQEADVLEEVCAKLSLTSPEIKKGKKHSILKLILKHLCDLDTVEEDGTDKGMCTILVLRTFIVDDKSDGDDRKDTIPSVPAETSLTDPSPKSPGRTFPVDTEKKGVEETFELLKLKDFKISGMIGGVGEKDRLSYSSLCYQIAHARKSGFSDESVCCYS